MGIPHFPLIIALCLGLFGHLLFALIFCLVRDLGRCIYIPPVYLPYRFP